MPQQTQAVEFTQEELTALGLVLADWSTQTTGGSLAQVISLGVAMISADPEVLLALIHRVIIKCSFAEEDFGGEFIRDPETLSEQRSRMMAQLDQLFAMFEEEGRGLFRD
jgi:hypothetical protein